MSEPLLVQGRTCGPCRLCCKVMEIAALQKPCGVWCPNACKTGCSIYEKRPEECAEFACLWLKGVLDDEDRPDRTRLVIVEVERDGTGIPATLRDPDTGVDHIALVARESHPGASESENATKLIEKLRAKGFAVALCGPEGLRCVYFPRLEPTTNGSTRVRLPRAQ